MESACKVLANTPKPWSSLRNEVNDTYLCQQIFGHFPNFVQNPWYFPGFPDECDECHPAYEVVVSKHSHAPIWWCGADDKQLICRSKNSSRQTIMERNCTLCHWHPLTDHILEQTPNTATLSLVSDKNTPSYTLVSRNMLSVKIWVSKLGFFKAEVS